MSLSPVGLICQKHQVVLHQYGGDSHKRCHECQRDRQLDLIEKSLVPISLKLDLILRGMDLYFEGESR